MRIRLVRDMERKFIDALQLAAWFLSFDYENKIFFLIGDFGGIFSIKGRNRKECYCRKKL